MNNKLGKLWIDYDDAIEHAKNKINDEYYREKIDYFIQNGYVVFEKAVKTDICDRITASISNIEKNPGSYVYKSLGQYVHPSKANLEEKAGRVVDLYATSKEAREATFPDQVSNFLKLIFEDNPLAFQSIYFHRGSQQAIHQDTAYVITKKPLSLVASWLSLQDIEPGSGELAFYPKSHKFDHFYFDQDAQRKGWQRKIDGDELHKEFLKSLHVQAEKKELSLNTFAAKKGDVFLWHADLAHGGSKIIKQDATRKSLVTHFCPKSVRPRFSDVIGDEYYEYDDSNGNLFASRHYHMSDLTSSPGARVLYNPALK
jgi:ectoine hydroxylase-related dioxygenase (phytanoyl-CoA dioxygenase family)